VELRQLATFVAVAEEGSFTRAADRLHVVQSAVSAGVRNLEKELGVMLFDRSTHSVKLTDAGGALLPEARATLAAAQAAKDAVDEARGGLRGTVVLGTMQAQGMRAVDLAGILAAFRAEHPAVEVEIRHVGGSSEMADEVRGGRLDLAFVALPGGLGTLEELFEVLTWRQLRLHGKPVALLDVAGFWEPLLAFLDARVADGAAPGQGKIGMALQTLTPDVAASLGIDRATKGAVITDIVTGSPAEQAGLRPGDVIVEIDRRPVGSADEAVSALHGTSKSSGHLLRVRGPNGTRFVTVK